MAKMLVNSQKLIGKNRVAIPDKHATDDDWKAFYHQMGLPSDVSEYQVEAQKFDGVEIDPKMMEGFKKVAHESGILPKQAAKVIDFYNEYLSTGLKSNGDQLTKSYLDDYSALQNELGTQEVFKETLNAYQSLVREFADDEDIKFLKRAMPNGRAIEKQPGLMRFLGKVAKKVLSEGQLLNGEGSGNYQMTPDEAKVRINEIKGNLKHPYYDGNHPNHKEAVKEVRSLYQIARPQVKQKVAMAPPTVSGF